VERYGGEEEQDIFGALLGKVPDLPKAPAVPQPGLTEEQRERMRRNKELAAQRKVEKEQREAEEKMRRDEEDDQEEVEREMLTGGAASEWSGEQGVAEQCLRTVQELHNNRNKGEESEEEEEEESGKIEGTKRNK